MESPQRKQRRSSWDALRHPARVRILEVCTDFGALSPIQIVNRGFCSDLPSMKGKMPKAQLSHIAYHCRELERAGLLTIVKERPVRGATEHFYRANSEAFFSEEEWAELKPGERRDISGVMWNRFVAQVEGAMLEDTFDSRVERILAWGPVDLDERGWRELAVSLTGSYAEVEQIRRDAASRLEESGETPMRATYGLFAFPSPRRSDA